MPEPIKDGGGEPTVEELQKQIENLNKGIAGYRDDSQKSKTAVESIKTELEKVKLELDTAKKLAEENSKKGEEKIVLNPEDQKKLEQWAKEQGFVTKTEMEVQKTTIFNENLKAIENQAVSEFLEKHPEYDKDEEWAKVKAQFDQYKTPISLSGYRNLLNKIYKELNPHDDGEAKARADIEKKKRLGLGGGSQHVSDDEVTIEDLQKKYPRLSKSQIEDRLEEIKALYKKKS